MADQVRQGDVFIERITKLTATTETEKPTDALAILAKGEATGHHHSVPAAEAAILAKGVERFLHVTAPTLLRHQEHAEIPLARGTYEITIQREYDEQYISRTVAD